MSLNPPKRGLPPHWQPHSPRATPACPGPSGVNRAGTTQGAGLGKQGWIHPAGSELGSWQGCIPRCALGRHFPPLVARAVWGWQRAEAAGGEVSTGSSGTGRPSAPCLAPGAHFPTTGALISAKSSEWSQGGPPALPLHLPHRSPAPAHVNAAAKVSEQSPDKELFLGAGARSEDTARPLTMGGRGLGFPRDHSAAEGPVRFPR